MVQKRIVLYVGRDYGTGIRMARLGKHVNCEYFGLKIIKQMGHCLQ